MPSISAARILAPDGTFRPGRVDIADGRIVEVSWQAPASGDLPDGYLVPGFVDLQVNGYAGVDFLRDGTAEWADAARRIVETGVTAFLPTFVSAPVKTLTDGLRRAGSYLGDAGTDGARVLGVHLEGPFLAPSRRGAHRAEDIVAPTAAAVDQLTDAGRGVLRLVTIAPERPGALAAIAQFRQAGAVVGIGHTEADDRTVSAAVDAGATLVTHLFNAMPALHHRAGGALAAGLLDGRLFPSLVVDLHNVGLDAVCIAVRLAGDRLILVTDAVAAAGMPPGRYELGPEPIEVAFGGPPRTVSTGAIAGSVVRMDDAVRNLVHAGSTVAGAVRAATLHPARALGLDDCGSILPGARADLVWLSEELRCRSAWVGGLCVYGPSRWTRSWPEAAKATRDA